MRASFSCTLRGCAARLTLIGASLFTLPSQAADAAYQLPAAELQAIVDAPRAPAFMLGPKRGTALLVSSPGLPSITDVSQPELKLAGLRLNPRTRAASRFEFGHTIQILDIATGQSRPVAGLPANPRIADTAWSADERWVAFSRWADDGVELWVLDIAAARAHRLISDKLNTTLGAGFSWMSGGDQLLVRLVPAKQSAAPVAPLAPTGPNALETSGGKVSQTRTYPDLLKTPADADQLEWQLQTQLATVDLTGKVSRLGAVTALLSAQASPDGKWILATQLKRPYSTLVPLSRFPRLAEIWDRQGKRQKTVVETPLVERMPSGNDAVVSGPRDISWRHDMPANLVWAEAQDGGDPSRDAAIRDSLFQQAAPFDTAPQKLVDLNWRFAGIDWHSNDLALVTEYWWKTRDIKVWRIAPGQSDSAPELISARKSEDRYANPGEPSMTLNTFGRSVLRTSDDGKSLLMLGAGASPEGDRPFLDRLDLATHKATRLWQSQAPYYERPVALLDNDGQRFVTSREAVEERPNYYVRDLSKPSELRALTSFPHPTPQLKGVQKQVLHYQRADGIALSGDLYLPPGYDPKRDGPRPMLMWAYPEEFKSADAASQVKDSPYRFNRISYWGPTIMLARGYVVLDHPTMPIVGEGKKEPNDSYLEQLKQDAQAAVDEVVRLGVTDRDHIAIGGHSYGAFMTANLLAHTRLFRAGIARSGAYNRTLTPFGFQSEDRNFWEAKSVYQTMAPFNYAEQIKDALLMIHGEMDNNPGTFPIQSERMYQALQGLGATSRLVMLPNESHAYRARESILHMLWEQDRWLEKYVKHAKPRDTAN